MSDFQVVKSHLVPSEMNLIEGDRVIFVVRDFRAVLASSIVYFGCEHGERADVKSRSSNAVMCAVEKGLRFLFGNDTQWNAYEALVYGSRNLSNYLGRSWRAHVASVVEDASVYVIRYEDLLRDTCLELRGLCEYFGHEVDQEQLVETVERQSFQRKREAFEKAGDLEKRNFLRSGKADAWKAELIWPIQLLLWLRYSNLIAR